MSFSFTSYYGIFDADMNPVEVIDVTKSLESFIKDGALTIPNGTSFDDLFPNDFIGIKFLQVQMGDDRKINILNDAYSADVSINLLSNEKQIVIVYFVFINPKSNWQAIISGQLSDIKSYGLLDEAELYVHITDVHHTKGVLELVKKQTDNKAIISQSFTNEFEYPALKLLHDLAKQYPDKTYLYFHTKGMSQNIQKRNKDEQVLLSGTFKHWRRHIQAFQDFTIHKIGLFPAKEAADWGGWIWYNFFIVRGAYLAECGSLPQTTDRHYTDRHYYESWLARYRGTIAINDCYAVFTNKKENFSHAQTAAFMDQLITQHTGKKKSRRISLRLRYPFIKIRK